MATKPPRKPPPRESSREFMDRLYAPLLKNHPASRGQKESGVIYFGATPDATPVSVSTAQLATHLHIVGGSGRGKSNALRVLVAELVRLKRERGEGFAIIDPHGTLAKYAESYIAAKAPLLASDLFIMDLRQSEKVLCFNPLRSDPRGSYFRATSVSEGLLRAFGATQSLDKPLVARVLVNLMEGLLASSLAITDSRYFLNRGAKDQAIFRHLLERLPQGSDLQGFWEHFDQFSMSQADAYAMGPANRLDALARVPALRRILGQTTVSLDFQSLMDRGGIAIFDLSREGTGVTVDGQHQLAALLVQEFRQVMEARAPDGARGFTLILDEFGDYTSPDFARVLTAARKFGLRVVFAHQHLGQMLLKDQDRTLFDAVLAIPNKIVFGGLPFDQAELLAKQVYLALLNPEQIKHQPTTVTWDPIPVKDVVVSTSYGGSEGEGGGEAASHGSSRQRSERSDAAVIGESDAASHQWSFSSSRNWSASEQEIWRTDYKKRIQKGPPIFRSIEEQVFAFAQTMNLNPVGTGILATAEAPPDRCRFPHRKVPALSDGELAALRKLTYDKIEYLNTTVADRLFEERQQKLLEAAPPPEGRVKRSRFGPAPKTVAKPSAQQDPTVGVGLGPPPRVPAPRPSKVPRQAEPDLVERYAALNLPHLAEVKRDLAKAATCFDRGDWRESILNTRYVLEGILLEVARDYSRRTNVPLPPDLSAKFIRAWLRNQGILDQNAWSMAGQAYSRLSDPLHPQGVDAGEEDALFWSRQAAHLAEFVLVRLKKTRSEKEDE